MWNGEQGRLRTSWGLLVPLEDAVLNILTKRNWEGTVWLPIPGHSPNRAGSAERLVTAKGREKRMHKHAYRLAWLCSAHISRDIYLGDGAAHTINNPFPTHVHRPPPYRQSLSVTRGITFLP